MKQKIPIVVFAQVPPPEHGQSRMVSLLLKSLRANPDTFDVHHVNSKFSDTLEDIGNRPLGKLALSLRYLFQAIRIRPRVSQPLLYYVPGPVKWSSVLRDWMLLACLRLFYRNVVFHWHAIGQGEWAHGSDRLALGGPRWLDRLARLISALLLEAPYASIAVSENSQKDSRAVGSRRSLVVNNGIEDPCAGCEDDVASLRRQRLETLRNARQPTFRILFLSHGTEEKGITDALDCMEFALQACDPTWGFEVTFAGGIGESVKARFESGIARLTSEWPGRNGIFTRGYLTGAEKHLCFANHDIFLAPSRWESFGLTVTEAMAYGMPVVAAASDGVKGVLPEDYPLISPIRDPASLSKNLLACCEQLVLPIGYDAEEPLRERFLSVFEVATFSERVSTVFYDLGRDTVKSREDGKIPGKVLTAKDRISTGPKDREIPTVVSVYLADQNPGHDRSYGISRMTQVILCNLIKDRRVTVEVFASKTSLQAPEGAKHQRILWWGTRRRWVRFLTDHFHPLLTNLVSDADIHYYPKGYLPYYSPHSRPSVVTVHDTIIQYDKDHYPNWRPSWEYGYWSRVLKHTLRNADHILTVSQSSKRQITDFMERHSVASKAITVTYEPCIYEPIPQPLSPPKGNHVIHLSSSEPHKRTAQLLSWWLEADSSGRPLPQLHLIGAIPPNLREKIGECATIVPRPFLADEELQAVYASARALILPSEIEGFGLPAIEAYYLGTPVCFVKGTSVEEILAVTTSKGGFDTGDKDSFFRALDEAMAMDTAEIRECGLALRRTYAAARITDRIIAVFEEVARAS